MNLECVFARFMQNIVNVCNYPKLLERHISNILKTSIGKWQHFHFTKIYAFWPFFFQSQHCPTPTFALTGHNSFQQWLVPKSCTRCNFLNWFYCHNISAARMLHKCHIFAKLLPQQFITKFFVSGNVFYQYLSFFVHWSFITLRVKIIQWFCISTP